MCLSQEDFVLCLSQEGFVDRVFPLTPCFKLDREMVVGLAELRVLASYCEVFIFRLTTNYLNDFMNDLTHDSVSSPGSN